MGCSELTTGPPAGAADRGLGPAIESGAFAPPRLRRYTPLYEPSLARVPPENPDMNPVRIVDGLRPHRPQPVPHPLPAAGLEVVAISDTADPPASSTAQVRHAARPLPDEVSIKEGHSTPSASRSRCSPARRPATSLGRARRRRGHRGDLALPHPRRPRRPPGGWRQRVILCSPPADAPDLTVVMGVNDDQLRTSTRSSRTAR